MSNMVLQCKESGDFKPHPEGIHPAVCVDVIDLGLVETEWQGQRRLSPKVRVVFESEQVTDDGRRMTISKTFTASLHQNARLTEFLGKWRGRPIVPGETIDLSKLIGACCTLVISQQQNMVGRTYASIDAVSKPTKKLSASGHYDPKAARERIEQAKADQGASSSAKGFGGQGRVDQPAEHRHGNAAAPQTRNVADRTVAAPRANVPPKQEDDVPYDPDVGF